MINESEGDELGEEMGAEMGLDQPGVIQVSPQDKEAIERVSSSFLLHTCSWPGLWHRVRYGSSFFSQSRSGQRSQSELGSWYLA
jgi:hypothetical protein